MSKSKRSKKFKTTPQPSLNIASAKPAGVWLGIPPAAWIALSLGFFIKLAYLISSQKSPFYQPLLLDPEYYHRWAQRILSGDLIGDGVFYGLPLYPYFLALCYKLSANSLLAVKIIQDLLGLVTLYFIYKIGEKLFSRTVGVIAIFLGAVYGPLFFNEGILIPETLSLPFYAASFYTALLFLDNPSKKIGVILGLLCGFAALTKAGIIPFVFVFAGIYLFHEFRGGQKRLAPALIMAAVFIGTLAPVAIHNFVYGKDAVFLTSQSGFNFYIGNNPRAEGVFVAPEGTGSNVDTQIRDSKRLAEREAGRELKPSEVSKFWSDKAWDFIRRNPADFLVLCGRKFILFFDAREISDVDDYVFCGNFNPMLRFPWLNFAVLGPLFLAGAVLCLKTNRYKVITYAWIFLYVTGILFFFVNARYRIPLLSIFFPVAAAAIAEVYEAFKKSDWKKLFIFFMVIGMGVALTQVKLVKHGRSADYVNAGDAAMKMNDYDLASECYHKALELEPDMPKANQAMGVMLSRMGRLDEAKEYYEHALSLDPNNYQSHNNLGLWYYSQRNIAEAKRHFLMAVQLNPDSSQAHNNMGMVYGNEGNNEMAIQEFEESLKLEPRNSKTHANLGLILYRMGRVDEARHAWETAVQISPDSPEAKKALELLKR